MRVEHVRAFVALAEELNFHRAAARVFVSQPTLTAQIAQLERSLGASLFDRGPAGTHLTPAGRTLLPVARDVLRAVDDLADGVGPGSGVPRAGSRRARRTVRVGVGPEGIGVATWPTLQAFAARRPDLEPHAVPLSFSTCLPALDRGDVEAVLLHGPVDELAHRRVTTVGHVPTAVIVPVHHPFAARAAIGLDDVAPLVRAVPPEQVGAAFTAFWLLLDHPLAPPVADGPRLGSEVISTRVGEVGRAGLVGLWPGDVAVPSGVGVVVRPLTEERLAPLQVATHAGWGPADDLVAAAVASVRAVADLVALTPARPTDRQN